MFATGLPTQGYGVAIPHTDVEHVNNQAICIAALKEPVEFNVMGNMNIKTKVSIIFMLALREPHAQLSILQSIIGIAQQPELLKKIFVSKDTYKIYNLVKEQLNKK